MRKARIDCFYFQAAGKRTGGNYCVRIYGSSLFLREKQRKPPRGGVTVFVNYSIRAMGAKEATQKEVSAVWIRT